VVTGWQLGLRARNVFGPYEEKVVLAQGATPINGPHQGALVDTANGEWWFIHFQDLGIYGRVVHLQPVHWQDGWPMMGTKGANGIGEPVLHHRKPKLPAAAKIEGPPTNDEFTSSMLGLQWQWHANHRDDWYSLTARTGWLRLFPQPEAKSGLEKTPSLLLQKLPARSFVVETLVELHGIAAGDEAGLAIVGCECAALAIMRTDAGYEVVYRKCGRRIPLQNVSASAVRLIVKVSDGGECTFAFATADGDFKTAPEKFQAQPGVWIGAKVGIYASRTADSNGYADFDYFRFGRVNS
jgi:beta-xylosidase